MKRFLLFGFNYHECFGGTNDFVCDFDNVEDIKQRNQPLSHQYQVIDTKTGRFYYYDSLYDIQFWNDTQREIAEKFYQWIITLY